MTYPTPILSVNEVLDNIVELEKTETAEDLTELFRGFDSEQYDEVFEDDDVDDDDEKTLVCTGDSARKLPRGAFVRSRRAKFNKNIDSVFRHAESLTKADCPIHEDASWSRVINLCEKRQSLVNPPLILPATPSCRTLDIVRHSNALSICIFTSIWVNFITSKIERLVCHATDLTDGSVYELTRRAPHLKILEIHDASLLTDKSMIMITYQLKKLEHLVLYDAFGIAQKGVARIILSQLPLKSLCIVGAKNVTAGTYKKLIKKKRSVIAAYCSVE
uniref:Putative a receptor for ubiquitination targets n=1 Tax=Ixodes ricinus TaxID=34613 RepID=A0A0K8R6L3_IXORI